MSLRSLPLLLLPALFGCGNPSLDVKIAALGGEVAGVEKGEFHRSGQPCIDCHGPYKGAQPEMILAGTIFAIPGKTGQLFPVEGAKITVTDALGKENGVSVGGTPSVPRKTNCAGNFWFTADQLPVLAFPYAVKVECPEPGDLMGMLPARSSPSMLTRISREGSCNACHHGDQTQNSPGWVVCDDMNHTGATVYPQISHDTCSQAFPGTSEGSTSGGVGP